MQTRFCSFWMKPLCLAGRRQSLQMYVKQVFIDSTRAIVCPLRVLSASKAVALCVLSLERNTGAYFITYSCAR